MKIKSINTNHFEVDIHQIIVSSNSRSESRKTKQFAFIKSYINGNKCKRLNMTVASVEKLLRISEDELLKVFNHVARNISSFDMLDEKSIQKIIH